jgi:hypothetical protein
MRAHTDPVASLDAAIHSAFKNQVSSSALADLIREAEAAAILSAETAEKARTRALDPALSAASVDAARREMADAAFSRDRLQEAVRRLGERLQEAKGREDEARRREAYNAALVEREKLAAELLATYPTLAEKLADLVARIATNDAAIERVNRTLPDEATSIAGAEMIARQLSNSNFMEGPNHIPRITQLMRLPAFRYSPRDPYRWPRPHGVGHEKASAS